jgi:hypothetical protein
MKEGIEEEIKALFSIRFPFFFTSWEPFLLPGLQTQKEHQGLFAFPGKQTAVEIISRT